MMVVEPVEAEMMVVEPVEAEMMVVEPVEAEMMVVEPVHLLEVVKVQVGVVVGPLVVLVWVGPGLVVVQVREEVVGHLKVVLLEDLL